MSYSSSVILFLSVAAETCVSEPLANNGLFLVSGVMSQYRYIYILHECVCNIKKASANPGSVQEIMPYH
jgi:hypothetical protein